MLPVGKFKAALMRYQAASLSSKFMQWHCLHPIRHSRCDNVRSSFQSLNQTILPAPFSTKFYDAPADVVSLLLCDWLQHATTLYEE